MINSNILTSISSIYTSKDVAVTENKNTMVASIPHTNKCITSSNINERHQISNFNTSVVDSKYHKQLLANQPLSQEVEKEIDDNDIDQLLIKLADKDELKCKQCNKHYISVSNLYRHIRHIHTNSRPYECHICHCTFKRHCDLKDHYLIHKNDRPFSCTICEQSFKTKSNLRKHYKTHLAQKKLKTCRICRIISIYNPSLAMHQKLHSICQSFKCSICNKIVSCSHVLNTHYNKHFEIKGYQCHVCNYKFRSQKNLALHLTVHTPNENIYNCEICGNSYYTKSGLQQHRKHHIN